MTRRATRRATRTATRRATATIATLALTLTACGGDDEPSADEPAAEQEDESATESADEPATDGTPAEEPPADEPPADEPPADEPSDDSSGDGDTIVARSIGDIPERCRDLMIEYFEAVEPIVADIDWETASFDDLEQVGNDIEAAAFDFETDSMEEECDAIEFPDDNEFELLVEFAGDEVPGVVGYLEFIAGMGFDSGDGGDDGAIPTPGEGFADCDEAIDYVQGLIDEYDTFQDVPAADIMQIAGLSTVIMTCTPEQLEFFDSPEVGDFLSGS